MWDKVKDKTATLVIDYLLDQVFNMVVVPLISLLAPLVIVFVFRLANQSGPLQPWQIVLMLAAWFLFGAAVGWHLRTLWQRRTQQLRTQVQTRAFEMFTRYESGRIPDQVDIYHKVHSKRKRPIKRIPLVVGYYAQSGYQDIAVQAIDYGTIENIRPTRLQRLNMDFCFDDELQPGGTAELKYRVSIVNKQEEPPPYQTVKAIYGPIREAKLRIRFAPDAVPARVWRAQWLGGVEGEPELLGEPLQPVHGTTYETTFRNLTGGLNIEYGLYWDWE